ncbi:hypothetical protein EHE19_004180 [Ruminiclostridium herbifermentans]|uniref:Lipoprotein n=1 Tax=Ruminiclostridium herbifermentans TaxID=2488810 RepID=A0A4U7JDI8_9FIRM|nr:hypothetical protein [Ruminiclostridium herbifermentans]QNU67677.1 hypothetical protein EHE19_004180 [Ruminiclostridium herbifermentans]
MRIKYLICVMLLISMFLCSCNGKELVSKNEKNKNNNEQENIIVKTEVTLGSCSLDDMNKDNYILSLRLYKGEYYEEYTPGSNFGGNWTGKFKLCIIDSLDGRVIDSYEISEWDEFTIKDKVNITLKDYNKDGNYEFLLGQYGSSNLNIYKMYYITKDFKIGYYDKIGEINISNESYSPELKINNEGNIEYSYYDNSVGDTIKKSIDINLLVTKN